MKGHKLHALYMDDIRDITSSPLWIEYCLDHLHLYISEPSRGVLTREDIDMEATYKELAINNGIRIQLKERGYWKIEEEAIFIMWLPDNLPVTCSLIYMSCLNDIFLNERHLLL